MSEKINHKARNRYKGAAIVVGGIFVWGISLSQSIFKDKKTVEKVNFFATPLIIAGSVCLYAYLSTHKKVEVKGINPEKATGIMDENRVEKI